MEIRQHHNIAHNIGNLKMKAQAAIHLSFSSNRYSKIVFQALEPETHAMLTSRSKVQIKKEDSRLTINIEAKDISALRATINSYLRHSYLTKNIIQFLDKLE